MTRTSLLAYIGTVLAVGCTHVQRYHVAQFDPADGKISEPAPATTLYTVTSRTVPAGHRVPVSEDLAFKVRQGTPLGFERVEDAVYAQAGDRRYLLNVGDDVELEWSARKHVPTRFGHSMKVALHGAGTAAVYIGEAALDSLTDDEDDDTLDSVPPVRHTHHH